MTPRRHLIRPSASNPRSPEPTSNRAGDVAMDWQEIVTGLDVLSWVI